MKKKLSLMLIAAIYVLPVHGENPQDNKRQKKGKLVKASGYTDSAVLMKRLHKIWDHARLRDFRAPKKTFKAMKNLSFIVDPYKEGTNSVIYKGRKVWSGKTTRNFQLSTWSANGVDYAVAMDGKNMVWENIKSISKTFEQAVNKNKHHYRETYCVIPPTFEKWKKGDIHVIDLKSIESSVVGNLGNVTYEGKEVWTGDVTNAVSVSAWLVKKGDKLTNYAVAWDGEKVIWENIKGAAKLIYPK